MRTGSLARSAAILLAATLLMFADVLFVPAPEIVSHVSTDVASQYLHWRAFGFGELARGNLALWNPHVYLGTPYLGGMQSALLYPPNWIHLLLPLPLAINWGVALHVFLLGLFTTLWARQRGLAPAAGVLSGLLAMFCGAHFGHVYAGHLSNLCSMAWVPLLLLAIDGWLERRSAGWVLLGAAAAALLALAGHPQYLYYTGLTAALYSTLRLTVAARRLQAAAGLLAMPLLGAALAAAQLLPAIAAAGESVRRGGTSFEFAASFSLPPENLLTLLVPYALGGGGLLDYWGRTYFWETGLFLGVSGTVLAAVGALRAERSSRRFATTMAAILLLLALGSHTPLFRLLHALVPGFDAFRGTAKFGFQASLFLALLAGHGLDRLLRDDEDRRRAWRWALPVAVLCAAAAAWVLAASAPGDTAGAWARLMQDIGRRAAEAGEDYLEAARYRDADFVRAAGRLAGWGLGLAAATAAALALLLLAARRHPRRLLAVAALAALEVFAASRLARPTFPLQAALAGAVDWSAVPRERDERILDPSNHNLALSTGALDAWGYDPGVSRRYAEFMTATQGGDPERASQYVTFTAAPRIYRLLRLRHALLKRPEGWQLAELPDPLPRLLLVHEAAVLTGRDAIFDALASAQFDPRRTAILEQAPRPAPEPATGPERVALLDESTDHLTIEAQLSAPGLLLVTDGWAEGWVASALEGSVQPEYEVLPADSVVRAIPLAAGSHRLRLEYHAPGFRAGAWISAGALLVTLAAAAALRRRRGAAAG